MTPPFSKTNPIQPNEIAIYQNALRNTQGNILKGHGRSFTANIFLHFHGSQAALKTAIRALGAQVTSQDAQTQQTADHKKDASLEALFVGFGLSARGYQYLGYDPAAFQSDEFAGGMARKCSPLHDTAQSTWEPAFQKTPDAMILLAHGNQAALTQAAASLTVPFQGLADIAIEYGRKLVDKTGEPIEQFGFVDGVSQPIFFQSDVPGNPVAWDPGAGTSLVLAKDPFGKSDDDCGTFYVFRKLAQNVGAFHQRVADLQNALAPGQDPGLAGAFIVGRFPDGTPSALFKSPQGTQENDFVYQGALAGTGADPSDRRCPISAHIRKVNPRGGTGDIAIERSHRIARRGITYGVPGQDNEVGLLFQCCQSDLKTQFEFVQGTWANTAGIPPSTGTDPLIGPSPASGQLWPKQWDTGVKVALDFAGFVTLKGGAYFFLPSITFLKQI